MSDLDLSFDAAPIGLDSSSGGSLGLALGNSSPSALANPQIISAIYPGIPLGNPNYRYSLTLTPAMASKFSGPQTNLTYEQASYDLQYLRAQGFSPPPLTWAIPPVSPPATVVATGSNRHGSSPSRGPISGSSQQITTTPTGPANSGVSNPIGSTSGTAVIPTQVSPGDAAAIGAIQAGTTPPTAASNGVGSTLRAIGSVILGALTALGDFALKLAPVLAKAILTPLATALGMKWGNEVAPNTGGPSAVVWIIVGVAVIWMVG